MKILAIDTSATAASVCLAVEDKILGSFYTNTALTHSQTLVPMVEQVLKTTQTDVDELDYTADYEKNEGQGNSFYRYRAVNPLLRFAGGRVHGVSGVNRYDQ